MTELGGSGTPVLIGPEGVGAQLLKRVPLTQAGRSDFDEAWLQRLVHENPSCLPVSEIEPGLDQFVAICREMPTPRGPLDNLLMTGRGDIALVETKLFRNPEARRQVLAQALDYATSLFSMSYRKFEEAALNGIYAPQPKPTSLYQGLALSESEKLPESAFVDAVTRNLHRGRALILLVGDGIREEAEELLERLQAHARFGFALALVELGVFRMPNSPGSFLIRPRTLAKTSIVRRTIVEVTATGAATMRDQDLAAPETLSEDNYWQALEAKVPGARIALEKLIRDVQDLKVYPDFLKSLVLRWDRPGFKPVNLGYITSTGAIWTDLSAMYLDGKLVRTYVEEIAQIFNCQVHALPKSGNPTPYKNDRPLQLALVMHRLDAWIEPMRRFIEAIGARDSSLG